MSAIFMDKFIRLVDGYFYELFFGLSGKEISKTSPERIDKITDRMKAEATAYIGLKGEMYKELIKKLGELE